uniref:Uncharacterized protein n=1 Tax=Hanusia phi TaxID=3032 RepID=A0A7S0HC86_9CRYP
MTFSNFQAYLFYSTYIFLCLMYPNLASEHGKLRLSLRGGQDPKLIAEALRDLKRMEKGQLPLFVEHMFDGYDDDLTCNDPNFEARPPPTLGSTSAMSDERMDRKQEQKTPVLTQEEEDRLDRERAKKHFEEVDAKFFYPHENVSHMYPPNIPQRRTFPEDPLERYKECRRYAQQIRHYLKNMPPPPKPGTPEHEEWIRQNKFDRIIDRNGTILSFNDIPRDLTYADELEALQNKTAAGDSSEDDPVLKSFLEKSAFYNKDWLSKEMLSVLEPAWQQPKDIDFQVWFRQYNSTFYQICDAYSVMNDLDLAAVRYDIEDMIEGDDHKKHVYEEFQDYGMQKWTEFRYGPLYNDDMAALMSDIEKVVGERRSLTRTYNVPRERDIVLDVGSSSSD